MQNDVAFGWLVEVTAEAGPDGKASVLRFNVAEPNKSEAIRSVRRRVAGGERATVTAVQGLSRHMVYSVLRLKRGEMIAVA